jgi:hypothetical protein
MPRGKVPSLLSVGNGLISFSVASRASTCSRCKAGIVAGAQIAQKKTVSAGFTVQKRLCLSCAAEIMAKTQADLDDIKSQL